MVQRAAQPGLQTRPREFLGTITSVTSTMGDSSLITFTAPEAVVANGQPGQFVSILCRGEGSYDPLIRRPYSICRSSRERGETTVLVRPYGRGSAWLCSQPVGAEIDVMGPMGNRFDVAPKSKNLLMVAGGVGAAPLMMLSEEAVASGLSVTYLLGAMNTEGLLAAQELPGEVEYVVATIDGSSGHQGFVTDLVLNYLEWADQVFACGPEPMFQSLRREVLQHRTGTYPSVQVSVERTMACGVGACLGCVVETKRGMETSCVSGPVYDMEQVIWT